jgi:hypothetical protein
MKKLIFLSTFFFSISIQSLPDCPSDTSVRWDNCFGTLTFANGAKYVGEWKDDKRHGQGNATFANGDKYVGEFKEDKYHGQGFINHANGDKYVGEWKDNNYHGQGTATLATGEKYVGYFMNGQYIPYICQEMGLAKGTESFGNCVNKLIDDL